MWALLVNSLYIMRFVAAVPMQAVKLRDWAAHEEAAASILALGTLLVHQVGEFKQRG